MVTEHWVKSDWFSALSGIASLVGLILSLWAIFQLRQLKVSYVARIRLVEIREACANALSLANDLVSVEANDCIAKARLEIYRARTHLEEAERYFPCGSRRRLRNKNKKISGQVGSVSDIMERYSECHQALIVIDSMISEKNWG